MRLQAAVGCETERKAPTFPTLPPRSRIWIDAPIPLGLIPASCFFLSCSSLEPLSSILAASYPPGFLLMPSTSPLFC